MGESIYKLIREKNKASFLTLKILVINLSCSRNILADEPKIAGNNPTSIEKTTTCHAKKKNFLNIHRFRIIEETIVKETN